MKLVVGLGNHGRKYEMTRHNIGQLALDQLSFSRNLQWKRKFQGLFALYNAFGEKSFFLKPTTFMNRSGESAQLLCSFFKIPIENILVVHDELDFPFGMIALKLSGGTAGHNGLKSMANHLGGTNFKRLRLGIGRPLHGTVSDYVLGHFGREEERHLGTFLSESAKAIELFVEKGFEESATVYSKKNTLLESNGG